MNPFEFIEHLAPSFNFFRSVLDPRNWLTPKKGETNNQKDKHASPNIYVDLHGCHFNGCPVTHWNLTTGARAPILKGFSDQEYTCVLTFLECNEGFSKIGPILSKNLFKG